MSRIKRFFKRLGYGLKGSIKSSFRKISIPWEWFEFLGWEEEEGVQLTMVHEGVSGNDFIVIGRLGVKPVTLDVREDFSDWLKKERPFLVPEEEEHE